jgi:hypoxanthine phosphoribosyltransferase
MKNTIHPDFETILLTEKQIQATIARLAAQLNQDYAGKSVLLIGILKGVIPFLVDLAKKLTMYCEFEFVAASSYHGGTATSKWVEIYLWPRLSLKNKDVLIIEDIVDTGLTLSKIKQKVISEGANSVKVVTLLDKPSGRKTRFQSDYVGAVISNHFVVGYGLDFAERYRNLPYVGILKPSIINLNPKDYPWIKE